MIDSHVHIDFEKIESELEIYIKKAKEKNIEEFTVTNHIMLPLPNPHYIIKDNKIFLKDMSFLKCSLITPDIERYITAIKAKEHSNVTLGTEIDYFENYEDEIKRFIGLIPFDLVLGSLHILEGYNVSRKKETKELLTKMPVVEVYKKYFTELRKLVKSKMFDIVCHADLIRKHSGKVDFKEYATEVAALIDDLLENDTGIEVNASGYAFIGDSYPSVEFLVLCKQKGLEKITIGSDAHKVEGLGENLERVIKKLKEAGYNRIVKFKNRQPQYINI